MSFFRHGFISAGFLNLTPKEAYIESTENGAIILDVREESLTGYKNFNVPLVIKVPYSLLPKSYGNLSENVPIIVADSVGLRSHEAMEFLKSKGFHNIANLSGGIVDWERDGLPLKTDKTEQLDGSCVCQLRFRHNKTD
jgi:rhodanese-related sulfurtransferase